MPLLEEPPLDDDELLLALLDEDPLPDDVELVLGLLDEACPLLDAGVPEELVVEEVPELEDDAVLEALPPPPVVLVSPPPHATAPIAAQTPASDTTAKLLILTVNSGF